MLVHDTNLLHDAQLFFAQDELIDGIDILIHSNDFFLDELSRFSNENNYNVCKQEKKIADCFRRLRGCDKLSFR